MNIGKIKLKNRIFLAPMVDVTDLPYRIICRRAGAGMAYTPMLYADQILHKNQATEDLIKTETEEGPLGIQITGDDPEDFRKIIPYLKKFDIVDINCGCPSVRIVGTKAGSYLLNSPEKIAQMISILKKEGLTVTAKIRLGFRNNNVLAIAKVIEEAGADAITVHGRTAIQSYRYPSDFSQIVEVKKAVSIPVIANGDIFSGKDAAKMLEICDGIMIGRGAIGDPEIFTRISAYLETGSEPERDFSQNLLSFQNYIELSEKLNVLELSRVKFLGAHFLKGFRGASEMRDKLMKCQDIEQIKEIISICQKN